MIITFKEKNLILGMYFFTMLILLLNITDNVPFMNILRKIVYPYILLVVFFYFRNEFVRINKKAGFVMAFLLLHSILFGFVFVNTNVRGLTYSHSRQLITMYLLCFCTTAYISKYKLTLEFYKLSYSALAIFLLWCAFTHPGSFVNPIYIINLFSRMERFRGSFGMIDVNICGNYCLFALILSIFLVIEWIRRKEKVPIQYYLVIGGIDFIILYMLLSTASRSGVLSLALFIFFVVLFYLPSISKKYYKAIYLFIISIIIIALGIVFFSGYIDTIWAESNREGNWNINLPIFLKHNNILTGMGYIDNSGFLVSAYGYQTTAMDVYYIYIFFTTGIIGSIIILIPIVYILYTMIRFFNYNETKLLLSLYLMMLFYAVWQVNLFSYRYNTGIITVIMILTYLSNIDDSLSEKKVRRI